MKELNYQKAQIRLRNKFLRSGVKMIGPDTIYFSKDTKIGKNVSIEPYVVFGLNVKIYFSSFISLATCRHIFLFTKDANFLSRIPSFSFG